MIAVPSGPPIIVYPDDDKFHLSIPQGAVVSLELITDVGKNLDISACLVFPTNAALQAGVPPVVSGRFHAKASCLWPETSASPYANGQAKRIRSVDGKWHREMSGVTPSISTQSSSIPSPIASL